MEPFLNKYKNLYDISYERTKIFKGKTLEITTALYTTKVPVQELVEIYGGTMSSVGNIAESTLLKIIKLGRKSLLPYPCNTYGIWSEEKDTKTGFILVSSSWVYARSENEVIELVHKYIPDSIEYTLDIKLLKSEVTHDSGLTFI